MNENELRRKLDTASLRFSEGCAILTDLPLLEQGLLDAVLGQKAAEIIEQHIDPALEKIREMSTLTEESAGFAYLSQLGVRLDDLRRAGADIATLLEAAFGASMGSEVEGIRKTVGTLTRQASSITATLQEHTRKLGK